MLTINSIRKIFYKATVISFVFSYAFTSAGLVSADDIDIYTKAASFGTGGDPVITFVIDTSGSMAYDINQNEPAGEGLNTSRYPQAANNRDIRNERMFLLQNALLDQITSMPGRFRVGLFRYSGSTTGSLERAADPLGDMFTSASSTHASSGTFSQDITQDVAWMSAAGVRDNENTLSFPSIVIPGGRQSLGATVQGVWQSTTGAPANISSASEDYAGMVPGNKIVKYYATSNQQQTFWLRREGSGSTPDPYLAIFNSSGVMIFSNDDYLTATPTCNVGWTYNGGSQSNMCHRQVQVNCGWRRVGWNWYWLCDTQDQYEAPVYSNADINSRIQQALVSGQEYTLVLGSKVGGHSGNWTLSIDRADRGYFYRDGSGSEESQQVALRFNQVNIPRGAVISSAVLQFTRSGASTVANNINVLADESLSPAPLQGTNIYENRSWFSQPTKFVVPDPVNFSIDVRSLLNDKVGQKGWCGGEDLVFLLMDGGGNDLSTPIVVNAQESANQPRLVVNWTHSGGSSCYSKTVNVKTNAIGDDVHQKNDGAIVGQSATVEMGQGSKAGLRFALVSLPNALDADGNSIGLNVTQAKLSLRAANNSNPGTIYIYAISEGIAQMFNSDPYTLDKRKLSAPVEWTPGEWNAGEYYESPDLATIIQPLLENPGWEYQGTIGLLISTSSVASTLFSAWEDNAANSKHRGGVNQYYNWANMGTRAAQLSITATASKPFENGTTVRADVVSKLLSNRFNPNGGTPIAGSYVEATEYMLGKGAYDSPLADAGSCQANTMVLLTDGVETGSITASDFTSIAGGSCSGTWNCANHLAAALKEGVPWYGPAQPDDDGIRALKTYTIGYGMVATSATGTRSNLQALANAGDGQFYPADDSAKLSAAFESIVGSISDSGASISVPGVAVSAFNRITLLDEVYYSLFKPSTRVNWAGNVKRYRLHADNIVDVNGNTAIDLSSSYFKPESQSWWSEDADGSVVFVGGAAAHISPVNRKLYTYMGNYGAGLGVTTGSLGNRGLDLADQGLNIMSNGSSLTPVDLGMYLLDDFGEMTPYQINARKEKIIEWIQGGTAQAPRSEMGAPIHSSPVMIGYKEDDSDLVSTVFMSTNEGYLHAIDTGEPSSGNAAQDKENRGGKELFAFMPRETLRQTALLEENAVKQDDDPYIYGLDSTWTFLREGGDNTSINEGTSDHVYIYSGMRRGGRMIYGLNVTSVYHGGSVAPKLLFAIGNPDGQGSTPVSGTPEGDVSNYADIGQTWSVPRVRKILWKGSLRTVLLFGGGYDTKHDDKSYEGDNEMGSQVYMTDAYTGELLWAQSTKSSITARLRPYDRTGDALIDSFYAVDVQGRILRFDLNSSLNDFVMHEVANLGGSDIDNRKFYEEPSIALIKNPVSGAIDVMIAVGSGYRPHPTDQTVQENFYMIFDRGAYAATPVKPGAVITQSDLVVADIENGISEDPNDAGSIYNVGGWYYSFEKGIGEKSLGVPLIFNGLVIFTSYVTKETGSDTCTPVIGQTRLYIMDISGKGRADIFNGKGAFLDDVSPGLASDIQVITIDGKPVILNDKAIIKPDEDKICEFVNCEGRDLDRSSWSSKTMSADEGRL